MFKRHKCNLLYGPKGEGYNKKLKLKLAKPFQQKQLCEMWEVVNHCKLVYSYNKHLIMLSMFPQMLKAFLTLITIPIWHEHVIFLGESMINYTQKGVLINYTQVFTHKCKKVELNLFQSLLNHHCA
jgi:hypothetical protein